MTSDALNRIHWLRDLNKVAQKECSDRQDEIEKLCDHKMPDGTTTLETGMMAVSCQICNFLEELR